MKKQIILICSPLKFYSQNDEDLCFEWIKKIKCIKKHAGVGRELHLHIASKNIPYNDLLDLMGLFARYKYDTNQLKIFMNDENKNLFDE
jgi:hypothetical protein